MSVPVVQIPVINTKLQHKNCYVRLSSKRALNFLKSGMNNLCSTIIMKKLVGSWNLISNRVPKFLISVFIFQILPGFVYSENII